jgi:NTP pyrophosphatase (non-canonical NTP hydrolase)
MSEYTLQQFSDRLNAIWDARLRENPAENIAIPALGLVGEAGEVSEHFKKHIRDGKPIVDNIELAYELGDVLHYWCRLAKLAGYTPGEIMSLNEAKLAMRRKARAQGLYTEHAVKQRQETGHPMLCGCRECM